LASIGNKRHPFSVRILVIVPSESVCLAIHGFKPLTLTDQVIARQALTIIRWHLHLLEMVGFRPALASVFLHHQSLGGILRFCGDVAGFDGFDFGQIIQPGSLLVLRCCPTLSGDSGMMHVSLHNPGEEKVVLGAKFCHLDDSVKVFSTDVSDQLVSDDVMRYLETLIFSLQSFWDLAAGFALLE
jgi:hypothetical protein